MASALQFRLACRALHAGGVIAYPTEAVWGLGCEPRNRHACTKLLHLKQRDWRKGMILIAADFDQLRPYVASLDNKTLAPALRSWPGPATWLLPTNTDTPEWVRGDSDRIAVRVTNHPVAAELCRRYGGALVSTSANRAGEPPALTTAQVRVHLGSQLDGVLPGPLGGLERPTPIRDLLTGELLRA